MSSKRYTPSVTTSVLLIGLPIAILYFLARKITAEERKSFETVFDHLGPSAHSAVESMGMMASLEASMTLHVAHEYDNAPPIFGAIDRKNKIPDRQNPSSSRNPRQQEGRVGGIPEGLQTPQPPPGLIVCPETSQHTGIRSLSSP